MLIVITMTFIIGLILGVFWTLERVEEYNITISKRMVNDFKIWWNRVLRFETNEEKIKRISAEIEVLSHELGELERVEEKNE